MGAGGAGLHNSSHMRTVRAGSGIWALSAPLIVDVEEPAGRGSAYGPFGVGHSSCPLYFNLRVAHPVFSWHTSVVWMPTRGLTALITYKSDIVLGKRYRDEQTGIEGVATGISFYQHGCERAVLELVVAGKIEEYSFDAPRLTCVETGQRASAQDTGGPRDTALRRAVPSRR